MEYFELGDLQQYLVQPLPELEAQQIAYQLLEGLEQLHLDGYAHRDLKPEVSAFNDIRILLSSISILKRLEYFRDPEIPRLVGQNR
jgi:serine/threonine protein kinase